MTNRGPSPRNTAKSTKPLRFTRFRTVSVPHPAEQLNVVTLSDEGLSDRLTVSRLRTVPRGRRSVRQAPSQALSSHAAGASQRTFHHRVTVTKERPETRLFCKLLVARDVDPVDASAVVSLARLDRLAADRAHKLFVVLAIPHRSPPSALQREDGRSSVAWCVLPAATAPRPSPCRPRPWS